MVEQTFRYLGDLRVEARHGPSQTTLLTDAPVDNQGKGAAFSPTDLLATSLGICMMTVMGIYARRKEIDLKGSRVHVTKEMATDPVRRVGRLTVTFDLPGRVQRAERKALENAAHTCPVHKSLHPDVKIEVAFNYVDR